MLSLACILNAGGCHCRDPNTYTQTWKGEWSKVKRARPIRCLLLCDMNKTERVLRMSLISRDHTHGQRRTHPHTPPHTVIDPAHMLIHLDHTDPPATLTVTDFPIRLPTTKHFKRQFSLTGRISKGNSCLCYTLVTNSNSSSGVFFPIGLFL